MERREGHRTVCDAEHENGFTNMYMHMHTCCELVRDTPALEPFFQRERLGLSRLSRMSHNNQAGRQLPLQTWALWEQFVATSRDAFAQQSEGWPSWWQRDRSWHPMCKKGTGSTMSGVEIAIALESASAEARLGDGAPGESSAPILAALEASNAVDAAFLEAPQPLGPGPGLPVGVPSLCASSAAPSASTAPLVAPPTSALAEVLSHSVADPQANPPVVIETIAVSEPVAGEGGKKKRRAAAIANEAADLTPEEAKQKAAEEGLTLVEAHTQTGYLYVYLWNSGGSSKLKEGETSQGKMPGKAPRVFQLQPQKGVSMGYYRSAEGAALAYARSIGIEQSQLKAAKVKAQPRAQSQVSSLLAELGNVSTEDALRMAVTENLTLVQSARSKSGYKHVATMKLQARPYRLNAQNGVTNVEGNFASAAGAALAHARQIGPEASAAEASAEQVRGEALELAPGGGFGTKVKLVPHHATQSARVKQHLLLTGAPQPDISSAGGASAVAAEVVDDSGGEIPLLLVASDGDNPAGAAPAPEVAATGAPGGTSSSGGVMTVPIGDAQMLLGEAALKLAMEEGLADKVDALRSTTNKSGFKNVTHHCDTEKHKTSKKSRPFQLTRHIEKSRRAASLGYFASAEAAALVQARILRVEERAAQQATHEQHGGVAHGAASMAMVPLVDAHGEDGDEAGGEEGKDGEKRKRKLSNPGGGYTCRRCGQPKKGHTCPNPRPRGAPGDGGDDDDDAGPTPPIDGGAPPLGPPVEVVPIGGAQPLDNTPVCTSPMHLSNAPLIPMDVGSSANEVGAGTEVVHGV